MADDPQGKEQRQQLPKMLAVKDEAFYANCTMVETTPFDISILFGKVRPRSDEQGNRALVEVYERQVYLSHLQAKALFEALGRSLESLSKQGGQDQNAAPKRQ